MIRPNPLAFSKPIEMMPDMAASLPEGVCTGNPKLLDRVRDVIRRKHYSFRTEQTYSDWIRRFILFHGKRHPSEMAEREVSEFLTSLARDGKVAASTQNQHVKASLTCQEQVEGRGVLRLRT